ncbi:MAG: hypothetical protein WC966_03810 [Bradymonadales bacterium]|jgi:cell division protein FtsN
MTSSIPALRTSTSSISTVKPRRAALRPVLIAIAIGVLLIVVVAVLVFQIITAGKEARRQADEMAQDALRPRRINAVAYVDGLIPLAPIAVDDSNFVDFSVFSSPSEASVYRNNEWVGDTPIEQMRLQRTVEQEEWLIVLDGYETERFSLVLDNDYSKVFTLVQKTAMQAPSEAEPSGGAPSPSTRTPRTERQRPKPTKTKVIDTGVSLPD